MHRNKPNITYLLTIFDALELCLLIFPTLHAYVFLRWFIWLMAKYKTPLCPKGRVLSVNKCNPIQSNPLVMHWNYNSLALSHWHNFRWHIIFSQSSFWVEWPCRQTPWGLSKWSLSMHQVINCIICQEFWLSQVPTTPNRWCLRKASCGDVPIGGGDGRLFD